jgi:hypothetical protein
MEPVPTEGAAETVGTAPPLASSVDGLELAELEPTHEVGGPDVPLGRIVVGGVTRPIAPASAEPDATGADLDELLRGALGHQGQSAAIVGSLVAPAGYSLHRFAAGTIPTLPVLEVEAAVGLCALVLNGAEAYFPADPVAPGARWVQLPRLRELYDLPESERNAHRNRWLTRIARANVGFTREELTRLATPALRLLVARFAAQVVPVARVERGTPSSDRGGATHGVTIPILRFPFSEPECYLPVIAEVEGRLESVNAWDFGAGISVGPIQVNVQRNSLFRILWALWEADRALFEAELGGPLGWSLREHDGHHDLVVGSGSAEVVLHGHDADVERNYRYFQSGVPGGHGYDPPFRRRVAEQVRNVLCWPHAQEFVLATSAWWLRRGLESLHEAGIPPLDARSPDRDVYVLKAALLSAYVRFSACLSRLLAGLAEWRTAAEKLANLETALAATAPPCPTLRDRLARQRGDAERVHDAMRALTAQQRRDAEPEEELAEDPGVELVRLAQEAGAEGAITRLAPTFELLASGGERPPSAVRPGDLLVRRLPGTTEPHRALFVDAELYEAGQLGAAGIAAADRPVPGRFAEVVEGPVNGVHDRGTARRIFDSAGRLPLDSALYRPTGPPAGDMSAPAAVEVEYTPVGGRRYAPVADAGLFRCAPTPIAVTEATLLSEPTTVPDDAMRTALRAVGVDVARVAQFEHGGGLEPLRPIASLFGAAPLAQLLRRLRYAPERLVRPPHSYDSDHEAAHRLGVRSTAALLSSRLLLAVPGHFRELARRAPGAEEAYALENLGWLLVNALRSEIAAGGGPNWWVPPLPQFAAPFANPLPPVGQEVQRLILHTALIDPTISYGQYRERFEAWAGGLAGRIWRFETGLEPSLMGPGRPFYPELVTIPAAVNVTAARQQIDQLWQQRVAAVDGGPGSLEERTKSLRTCDNTWIENLHLLSATSLGGLGLTYHFPVLAQGPVVRRVQVLHAVAHVFDALFTTAAQLGWNDLLFNTEGAGCFRGRKHPPSSGTYHSIARVLSDHGYGLAFDVNVFENQQGTHGVMDPRLVALFEAFRFRWGRCFATPDPHHFEYCGDAC